MKSSSFYLKLSPSYPRELKEELRVFKE